MDCENTIETNSTGPTTSLGKQASAANSLRHGFCAQRAVLEDESHEDFLALLMAFLNDYQPQNRTEQSLVENMVVARWRQLRLWSLESAALTLEMNYKRYDDNLANRTWDAFRTLTTSSRSFEHLNRYDARFEREFRHNLKLLHQLREEKSRKRKKSQAPRMRHLWWIDHNGDTCQSALPGTSEEESSFGKKAIAELPEYNPKQQESKEE